MRDEKRIDIILEEIGKIWHKYSDMRLGQLIGNVLEGAGLYYVEDESLLDALKKCYDNLSEDEVIVKFAFNEYILDLIKKHPDELGFVLQSKDYDKYRLTFADEHDNFKEEDVVLTELEFNNLKDYFQSTEEKK